MNLLTVIVILIFAIFALRGYQKGFVKSLASMISIVLSIVLVNFATPYVTDFLRTQTPVYEYIVDKCEKAFPVQDAQETPAGQSGRQAQDAQNGGQDGDSGQDAQNGGQAGDSGKDAQRQTQSAGDDDLQQAKVIDSLPLPGILKNLLKENNTPQYYAELAANTFADYVPRYMANLILSIISFVTSWLLVISFIGLAVMTLDVITELPVVHGLNQLLGIALGLLQGLVVVWIAFLIVTLFMNTDTGKQLMAMIAESPFLNALYENNILLDFLTNLLGNLV